MLFVLFLCLLVAAQESPPGAGAGNATMATPSLSSLFNPPNKLPRGTYRTDTGSIVSAIIFGIVGLGYCFWGFHLFEPTLFFTGFFICTNIAATVMTRYSLVQSRLMLTVIAVGVGFLGGSLLTCCVSFGVAMIGAFGGAVIANIIITSAGVEIFAARIALIIVLSLAGSILIQYFERPIIIATTSLAGAYIIVFAADLVANVGITYDVVNGSNPQKESYMEFGVVGVLAIIGMIYQSFRHTGRFGRSRKPAALPSYYPPPSAGGPGGQQKYEYAAPPSYGASYGAGPADPHPGAAVDARPVNPYGPPSVVVNAPATS